jgi:hypothetical protein
MAHRPPSEDDGKSGSAEADLLRLGSLQLERALALQRKVVAAGLRAGRFGTETAGHPAFGRVPGRPLPKTGDFAL